MITRFPYGKQKFNAAAKQVKELIKEKRNLVFQEFLQNFTPAENTNYFLWKVTCNIKNQPIQPIPPIRKPNRSWARANYKKAKTFAEHLEKVSRSHQIETPQDELQNIEDGLSSAYQLVLPIKPFTINKIVKIILFKLKRKKAPGYDLTSEIYAYIRVIRMRFFGSFIISILFLS